MSTRCDASLAPAVSTRTDAMRCRRSNGDCVIDTACSLVKRATVRCRQIHPVRNRTAPSMTAQPRCANVDARAHPGPRDEESQDGGGPPSQHECRQQGANQREHQTRPQLRPERAGRRALPDRVSQAEVRRDDAEQGGQFRLVDDRCERLAPMRGLPAALPAAWPPRFRP